MEAVGSTLERLNAVRGKVDSVRATKGRLEGELSGHQKRLTEIEAESKQRFKVAVDGLPEFAEARKQEGEKELAQAEALLGLAQQDDDDFGEDDDDTF